MRMKEMAVQTRFYIYLHLYEKAHPTRATPNQQTALARLSKNPAWGSILHISLSVAGHA